MWILVPQGLILEKKRKKKAKCDLGSDTSSVWKTSVETRGGVAKCWLFSLELDLTLKIFFIIFR